MSNARVTSVRELLAEPPLIHEWMSEDGLITHGLLPDTLAYIERVVQPGQRTLETGAGLSTIVFALRSAHHLCVTPDAGEANRIRQYCSDHAIDTGLLTFHHEPSERALLTLDLEPLDLVLIDGSHSFPQVFMDWFFTQQALRVGGTVLIDDVHIWTGRVLRDFLRAEPEWELAERWAGRTVAFRKMANYNDGKDWDDQAYVWRHTRPETLGRARLAAGLLSDGNFKEFARRTRALVESRNK